MEKKKKSQGGVKTLNRFRLSTNKTRNVSSIGLNSISEGGNLDFLRQEQCGLTTSGKQDGLGYASS